MARVSHRPILLSVALLVAAVVPIVVAPAAEAHPVCPDPVATGDRPGHYGSPHAHVVDGNENTSFYSSYDNWQYVRVDLGCVSTFSGLSRKMGFPMGYGQGIGVSFLGQRDRQGEAVAYSVNGRDWTDVTHATSSGWENFGPYAGRAWHSVDYGWSDELRLDTPAQARYVLFRWDGDNDMLYELDIDFDRAGPLRVSLACLGGEPLCTATPSGGHAGGFTYVWTSVGVSSAGQVDSSRSSLFTGSCRPGNRFSVEVTVTDDHGRTVSASRPGRCATFRP